MENFHKYPKIRPIDHEDVKEILSNPEDTIFIEEKIDGACMRFMVKDGKVIIGSRNRELTEKDEKEKNWMRSMDFIKSKVLKQFPEYLKGIEHFIFYGEGCFRHSISYDWDKIPPFLGFDIYDLKDNVFLSPVVSKPIFHEMGIPFVPIIWVDKVKNLPKNLNSFIKESYYG